MREEFIRWLKQNIEDRGWSVRETSRRAGLSPTPINQMLSGEANPSLDAYNGLCDAFDVELEFVLRLAGELPPTMEDQRAADPALDEGCRLLARLSPGDRRSALRMLRGLASSAKAEREVTLAREIEQTFYEPETPLQELPDEERQAYYEMFKTLARLATVEDLEWAEEWFQRAREGSEGRET